MLTAEGEFFAGLADRYPGTYYLVPDVERVDDLRRVRGELPAAPWRTLVADMLRLHVADDAEVLEQRPAADLLPGDMLPGWPEGTVTAVPCPCWRWGSAVSDDPVLSQPDHRHLIEINHEDVGISADELLLVVEHRLTFLFCDEVLVLSACVPGLDIDVIMAAKGELPTVYTPFETLYSAAFHDAVAHAVWETAQDEPAPGAERAHPLILGLLELVEAGCVP
ncbi:hypothetical protein V2W30_41245 (plasmid) [Streptomyces sp. Q6]|uniref:Uncharacterized protein n=1 Tax=Streptomyces citrinus TaxID=3118173 RepID=A0ACD5AQR3_9ACTN